MSGEEETLWHYCSTETLMSIAKKQEFWLGNLFFMNDSMEFEWFRQLALEAFNWWEPPTEIGKNVIYRFLKSDHLKPVYCGCFSRIEDDLSQWRGYADDGRGVAIGFDLSEIIAANTPSDLKLERHDVVYDEEVQRQLVREDIDAKGEHLGHLIAWIAKRAPTFKNPAFAAENEVRVVLQPRIVTTDGNAVSDFEKLPEQFKEVISFRIKDGGCVPYAAVKCPTSSIKALQLGPRHPTRKSEEALQLFLKVNQIDVVPTRSKASYR